VTIDDGLDLYSWAPSIVWQSTRTISWMSSNLGVAKRSLLMSLPRMYPTTPGSSSAHAAKLVS
jgi:hypothetical protein